MAVFSRFTRGSRVGCPFPLHDFIMSRVTSCTPTKRDSAAVLGRRQRVSGGFCACGTCSESAGALPETRPRRGGVSASSAGPIIQGKEQAMCPRDFRRVLVMSSHALQRAGGRVQSTSDGSYSRSVTGGLTCTTQGEVCDDFKCDGAMSTLWAAVASPGAWTEPRA
jgi:hypothetical protein